MSLVRLVNPDRLRALVRLRHSPLAKSRARDESICVTPEFGALDLSNLLIDYSLSHRSRAEPDLVERVSARVFRNDIELSLGEGELRTLGAALLDGTFANLGLLLSDQCTPTVKAALFADDDRNIFTAREECTGSVLKQLSDAYAFLEHDNRYRTEYSSYTKHPHRLSAQPQRGWHAGDRSKR